MRQASKAGNRGFTLIEMMISLAVSMIVLAAAVQLFSQGVDATWVESQKAEMQQDLRAASNLLVRDISLAGTGLPVVTGVTLPNGGGAVIPIYGCNQSGACLPTGAVNYPTPPGGAGPPTMYSIIPGWQRGITPPGSVTPSDIITVVYTDPVLALPCYLATFPAAPAPSPVTFTLPGILPSGCLPAGVAAPQALNNLVVGLQAGDVLLFGMGSSYAVAEVTGVAGGGAVYNITFANADPLRLNQSGALNGDLAQIAVAWNNAPAPKPAVYAIRLEVITYYLMNQPDPAGIGTGTPILMRQVNGHTAIPVAENVINLQFTYDTYNSDGTLLSGAPDGGYSTGNSYNLIRKVNLTHMSIRSTLQGVRTALMSTRGYQTFDYQTSVSARNLSYQQRY